MRAAESSPLSAPSFDDLSPLKELLTNDKSSLRFGRLADLYGRKLVFNLGTGWLLAWCIGCALAPTRFSIIFMRALQAGTSSVIFCALLTGFWGLVMIGYRSRC